MLAGFTRLVSQLFFFIIIIHLACTETSKIKIIQQLDQDQSALYRIEKG